MSLSETKNIRAIMIIEVIGRPPEHLTETLENIAKNISEEKGVRVVEKEVNSPITMKENKDFYTSFAEIEVEVEAIMQLVALMLKYMPAHIEIISPEFIASTNNGWNDILNETVRRLHGYDEVARIIQTEKTILEKKLRELTEKNKEGDKPKRKKRKLKEDLEF